MAAGILKIDRTPDSLRNRRKHLGWTQHLLSMVSGVDLPRIVDFESGRAKLSDADSERLWKVVEAAEACFRQKNIRNHLVSARLDLGLTQDQVANDAGIDLKDYSSWEEGQVDFDDLVALEKIRNALNTAAISSGDAHGPLSLSNGGLLPLSALASISGFIEDPADQHGPEPDKGPSTIDARRIKDALDAVQRTALRVAPLEAENAALKQRIADLEQEIERLSKSSGETS